MGKALAAGKPTWAYAAVAEVTMAQPGRQEGLEAWPEESYDDE